MFFRANLNSWLEQRDAMNLYLYFSTGSLKLPVGDVSVVYHLGEVEVDHLRLRRMEREQLQTRLSSF
jgi:hypothetical protein